MSTLSEDDVRRLACNEWARYMEVYGHVRPSYLNKQRPMQPEHRACGVVPHRQQITTEVQ